MKYFPLLFTMVFVSGCNFADRNQTILRSDASFEQNKDALIRFKENEKVEGLAFAIFDSTNVIWQKCLGTSTYGYPINDKTLFSIQSISKNVTALATMIAAQDGLLDLDAPISRYLPEFKISSQFEMNPEKKITLQMLLSHTAGFVHEAPVGNNYNYTPCSFEDHLKSIRSTKLKFPVGTAYSYSNCGVDIAAEIVEQASGMKFQDYLKLKIFEPLGMTQTTIDDDAFAANTNKTEGNMRFRFTKHYKIPLIGSGAVYSNLSDFIKYGQLQMNWGNFKNKKLVDRKYLYDMYTIKFENYGLGTYVGKSNNNYYMNHNGMGYGYSATLLWFPEYTIGCVLLCNNAVKPYDYCDSMIQSYIRDKKLTRDPSVTKALDLINGSHFNNKSGTP